MNLLIGDLFFPEEVLSYLSSDRELALIRAARYAERTKERADAIRPFLSHFAFSNVLDIGSGLAGIDIYLARYSAKTIHLMDGSGNTSAHVGGFNKDMQPWADVAIGQALVRANCDPSVNVIAVYANPKHLVTVDLIISLISWGHHYPVDIYIPLAKRCLPRGGKVILDIRMGTDGLDVLQRAGFNLVAKIQEARKNELFMMELVEK